MRQCFCTANVRRDAGKSAARSLITSVPTVIISKRVSLQDVVSRQGYILSGKPHSRRRRLLSPTRVEIAVFRQRGERYRDYNRMEIKLNG